MIEITKTPGYQVGETFYPTAEAAQQGALASLFGTTVVEGDTETPWTNDEIAKKLIENKDSVIAILRLKPRKKRAARKVAATAKPAPKKRKATVEEETPTGN